VSAKIIERGNAELPGLAGHPDGGRGDSLGARRSTAT
jgi:hypothetical protein